MSSNTTATSSVNGQAFSVAPGAPRPTPTPVLVVLNPDGFVEVYGDNISVHIAQRLDVAPAPYNERVADELLDAKLPWRFKQIYFPSKRRACGQCRRVTVEDELDRQLRLELARECRAICNEATR